MHATPCPTCGQLVCKPKTLNANQEQFGKAILDLAFDLWRVGVVDHQEATEALAAVAFSFAEGLKAVSKN